MASSENNNKNHPEVEDEEDSAPYKAPAMKSVDELKSLDAEDTSLQTMKQKLLPQANPIEPDNPKNVLVRQLTLVVENRPDVILNLTEKDLNKHFVIKEGETYRLRISFYVQREIVSGLKYIQKAHRAGVPVDTQKFMVGSYAPSNDMHTYVTPLEEAPSGMMGRGTYTMKSLFTDDDKNEWLKWEWKAEIKKDWE